MAYNGILPVDNTADIRENFRALKEDKIVAADTATKLETARKINGVEFNGTKDITITAAADGGNADTVNGKHAADFAPAGYMPPNATEMSDGSMSAADKTKLDNIAAGAEVNQNAFSNLLVGEINIQADSETDTLKVVAGDNIALTPDAINDSVTIAVVGKVASAVSADTAAACTGNAMTATKLENARTINGVSFNGTENITISQINGKNIATTDNPNFIGSVNVEGTIKASNITYLTKGEFFVGGDINSFYPVVFSGIGYNFSIRYKAVKIDIWRYVHTDAEWKGSLQFSIEGNADGWGAGSNYCKTKNYFKTLQFVADAKFGSYSDVCIVWLRGNTTYKWSGESMDGGIGVDYSAQAKTGGNEEFLILSTPTLTNGFAVNGVKYAG